ncbi:MAG TPA: porin [Kiritimatiellia bacterium]|nr:porin [Kiritimatiellia bacterium]
MKKIIALLCAASLAGLLNASAQDLESKVNALEKRIAELEKPAAGSLQASWRPGLSLASADKAIQLRLGGRIQNDWSYFLDADEALDDAVGSLDDSTDFRRIWLEMEGTLYERTIFAAHVDFVGGKTGVRNMFIGVKDIRVLGTVRVGNQQEPFGLEEITSNNNLTFLERSLSLFYPSYNAGIRMLRTLADKRMSLSAGVFRDTDDTGKIVSDDGYNLTARLTGLPFASEDSSRLVHLGFAVSSQTTPNDVTQFRGRPENRLAPYFVGATNIPADEVMLLGAEFAAVFNSLSLQAEWVTASAEHDEGDSDVGGYYVQASYFLTGEVRPYDRNNGAFGRITPKQNFGQGGIGAWELALRASGVDLNDGEVAGGEMSNITAGINWYLNPNVRMMLNYIRSDLDTVGEADTLLARFQVAF